MHALFTTLLIFTFSNLFGQSGFDENNYNSYFQLENYLTNSSDLDQVISETSAIYFQPSSEKMEQLEKEYGEEDFFTIVDDNNWYDYESSELLKKLGIKTVYLESGIVKF